MNQENRDKQLLILAGLSGAGKSTLIESIAFQESARTILQQLKIDNLSNLTIFNDADLLQLASRELSKSMILHYDLYYDRLHENNHQQLKKITKQFDKVVVLTIYVPPKILLQRHNKKITKTYFRFLRPFNYASKINLLRKQQSKKREYQDYDLLDSIYQNWLDFVQSIERASSFTLDGSQNKLRLQPLTVTQEYCHSK